MTEADRISELLLHWEELREQGQEPAAVDLCRDCPELRPEVERRIEALKAIYRIPNDVDITATVQGPEQPLSVDIGPLKAEGYEILELLGSGGMGKVFKARQAGLKRLVALKMILAGAQATPQEAERFRVEAEAVARLQHPNIVQIYDIGATDGCPYLALEYLAGGSLDKRLHGQPLSPRQAAMLVRTLAQAIHCAHQHNIVHRDLKPANILLAPNPKSEIRNPKDAGDQSISDFGFRISDFTPKIADFGLAKRLDEVLAMTHTGAVLGTPSYMAPEQAEGRIHQIGPRTDIYALGAILYELLTGRPLFPAAGLLETLERVRSEEPQPPRQVQPALPADLETICLKCLRKDPAERYATAEALAEDLTRFLEGEPIEARSLNLVDRLTRTLNRTGNLPDLRRTTNMFLVLGPVPLLAQVLTYLILAGQPSYPLAATLVALGTLVGLIGLYYLVSGEGVRIPLTTTTRHLWAVRLGLVFGMIVMVLVSYQLAPPDRPWDLLAVFPLWSVLGGATMFGLGGIYWGRLYLLGLGFLLLAVLMPLRLEWAPLAFGLVLSTFLQGLAWHMRRIHQEQARFQGNGPP